MNTWILTSDDSEFDWPITLEDLIITWKLNIVQLQLTNRSGKLKELAEKFDNDDLDLIETYKKIALALRALQFISPKYLRTAEFSAYRLQLLQEDVNLDTELLLRFVS